MRRNVVLALAGVLVLAVLLPGSALAAKPDPRQTITEQELTAHVATLASDDFGGRGTGEEGIDMAAEYIADYFEVLGLQTLPGADNYFVDYSLYQGGFDPATTEVTLTGAQWDANLALGEDCRPFSFSDPGDVQAPVVFAGYGISAPEHDWDDYEGLDVEGKLVFVFRHEPHEDDENSAFAGKESTSHAMFTSKARAAQAKGALGMILVTDPLHHDESEDFRDGGRLMLDPPEAVPTNRAGADEKSFVAVQISRRAAEAMVAAGGQDLVKMQEALDDGLAPMDMSLEFVQARVRVGARTSSTMVPAKNVVAFLPGRDKKLKDEWLVVGAHYDHLGSFEGEGDTVYNGADDNASGTSGMMVLARALSLRKKPLKRSVVFMAFAAEERGLLGSRAMIEKDLYEWERTAFMLNMDMIGRKSQNGVSAIGDGYTSGLTDLMKELSEPVGMGIDFQGKRYFGNSDHDPFYRKHIPFIHLFTGIHEDYHRLGDHTDKVDGKGMAEIIGVAYGILDTIGEAKSRPSFIHHLTWLGARAETVGKGKKRAATFTEVTDNSRAKKAGIRAGDRIAAVDRQALEVPEDLGKAMKTIKPGATAILTLQRGKDMLDVEVTRAKPGYMGVMPQALGDEQAGQLGLPEGQGFVLARVVPSGPSAVAGLQAGDVVYGLDGNTVDVNNLGAVLQQIGGGEEIDVLLIRDGEKMTLPMILGERK